MLFFAVAQIFLSFAPLLDARQGPNADAHVEEAGTTLHHAHNEADCAACTARGLMHSAEAGPRVAISVTLASSGIVPTAALLVESDWSVLSRSRAPPASSF